MTTEYNHTPDLSFKITRPEPEVIEIWTTEQKDAAFDFIEECIDSLIAFQKELIKGAI